MAVPVAHDTSGQSDSTEHASKPRVMESPTAAIEAGLLSQPGVGVADGFVFARAPSGAGEAPPPASHPATPSRAAVTTATTARERRLRFRILRVPPVGVQRLSPITTHDSSRTENN
ncbi:hypothetical protein GCM10009540_27780 [Streptomyces turgidiscabies]